MALFFIIPFELYYTGREYWNWNRLVPVSFAVTGTMLYLAAAIFTRALFKINGKLSASFIIILFWLGAFVLLADVFAPLQTTPLDGSELTSTEPLKYTLIEAGIFLALLGVALKFRRAIVPAAAFASSLLIIISAVYLALIVSTGRPNAEIAGGRVADSGIRGNVYHILLDEMQTDVALLYLKRNGLEEDFKGFTVFENNMSNYLYTNASLPSYLSGTLYANGSFTEWAKNGFIHTGIFKAVYDKGYDGLIVAGVCPAYFKCVDQSAIFRQHTGITGVEYRDFVQIWLARALPNMLSTEALAIGKNLGQFAFHLSSVERKDVPVSQSEGLAPFTSALAFRQVIEAEKDMAPDGRYLYLHALLPHYPFVMDEHCEYNPGIDKRSVNGYYQQAGCGLHLVVDFINELKRLGRYDAATIVIHGDTGHGHLGFIHEEGGALTSSADPKIRKTPFMPQFAYWSEEQLRARVSSLLMIKPAYGEGKLSHSTRPSQLIDLYPTLINLLALPRERPATTGYPLFEKDFPKERQSSFFIYGINDLNPDEVIRIDVENQQNLPRSSLAIGGYVKEVPPMDFPADGITFDIGSKDEGRLQCRKGFSGKERAKIGANDFRWATGRESSMVFRGLRLPEKKNCLLVTFKAYPAVANQNKKVVLSSRLSLAGVSLKPGWSEYSVALLFPAGEDPALDISYADAASPKSLGINKDPRELAVAWSKISLQYNEPYAWGDPVTFGKAGNSAPYLSGGWSDTEAEVTWTSGKAATLVIPVAPPKSNFITLKATFNPFIFPGKVDRQTVRVLVNGRKAGTWDITKPGLQEQTLRIPASLLSNPCSLDITFDLPDAISPAEVGYNMDRRVLALAFHSLKLSDK